MPVNKVGSFTRISNHIWLLQLLQYNVLVQNKMLINNTIILKFLSDYLGKKIFPLLERWGLCHSHLVASSQILSLGLKT